MRLSRLPEIVPHFLVGPVQHPLLFAGGPPRRAAPGGGATEKTHSLFSHYVNIYDDDAAHQRGPLLST